MNPRVVSYEAKTDTVVAGTTATPSQIKIKLVRNEIGGRTSKAANKSVRVRLVNTNTSADSTNAVLSMSSDASTITTVTTDKEYIIKELASAYATGTLTLATTVADTETITIGSRVYEIDSRDSSHVTTGRVRVNVSASATKSQGTLRLGTIPTAGDLTTIGDRTYVWVANGAASYPGEVSIGTTLALAETNLIAAVNGTDGWNTAHPNVTIAVGTHTPATVTLTLANVISDTETVTIGNKVYTFQTTLTNVDGNVLIGANAAASLDNLKSAVNLTAGAGTTYATAMTGHTQVTATTNTDTTQVFSATILAATSGNATAANLLASTETLAGASNAFGAATFTGALDNYVITALSGGVLGDLIATTETFTASGNTFDAATLGTTTAGVNCSAANAVTAIVAAVNGDSSAIVTAADGAGNTVVVTADTAGTAGNSLATTETLAGGSNAFGAATLTGGIAVANGTMTVVITNATAETVDLIVSDNVVLDGVPFADLRVPIAHAAP